MPPAVINEVSKTTPNDCSRWVVSKTIPTINAPTISVVFSKVKNQIIILQRNEDNTISKTLLKTYKPSDSFDRYLIEITDKVPNYLESKSLNSTCKSLNPIL